MKTTQQIEDDIKARQAELQSLVSEHEGMVRQFNQKCAENQRKATLLEGYILGLQGMLPKPKREKKNKAE